MFFAHPVLREGSDDFPEGSFSVDIGDATISEDSVEFTIKAHLECPSLRQLVDQGHATVSVFITCQDTRINRFIQLTLDTEKPIKTPSSSLFGRVDILPILHSSKEISDWKSTDLHSEYQEQANIPNASPLAVGEEKSFTVDRKRLKPLESIFELEADDKVTEGRVEVDTDNPKISIHVNPTTKDQLDGLRNSSAGQAILLNSVYLPALMEVFSQIQNGGTSPDQHAWYRVFKAKCDAHTITPETCQILEASQVLLGTPFLVLQPITADIL